MANTIGSRTWHPATCPPRCVRDCRYRAGTDVYKSIKFADEVTNYYKSHETVDYTTKLGSGRMRDIIGQPRAEAQIAFRS